jgi:hypothetical protein
MRSAEPRNDDRGMTTISLDSERPTARTLRLRPTLLAAATGFAAVSQLAFFVLHREHERDEMVPYDVIHAIRTQWWVTHYFVGTAMAFGFGMVGLAIAALVRHGRGSTWTTVGAALCLLGAPAVAAGVAAEGAVFYYVTDQAGISKEAASRLLTHTNPSSSDSVIGLLVLGLLVCILGSIAGAVGLIASREVPLWVPVALVVGTVGMAAAPFSVTWLVSMPRAAAILAVGWYLVRGSSGDRRVP